MFVSTYCIGLDILVNNAAMLTNCDVVDLMAEDITQVLKVNVISPPMMSKEAIPHLRKTKGNIVFLSSVTGEP